MREFSTRIEEHFKNGLKKDWRNNKNANFLHEAKNVIIKRDLGAVSIVPLINEINLSMSFPFPQLFRGREASYVLEESKIYSVNEDTWELTEIITYNAFNQESTLSIIAGGPWHFIDCGTAVYFLNGNCIVFRTNISGMFGNDNKMFTTSVVTITAGCEFSGRVLFGGFAENNFLVDQWKLIEQQKKQTMPEGIGIDASVALKKNFVMWSSIGGGDSLLMLFPQLAMTGVLDSEEAHNEAQQFFMEMIRRNEFGFMPMTWSGKVLAIKNLGKGVIVYGENGIAYMPSVSSPFPTFGLIHISNIGIYSRGSVGGNVQEQVFVLQNGDVCLINANLQIQKLGYREYIYNLLCDSFIVTYDENDDKYYMTDGSTSYILGDGLSSSTQHPTNVETYNGLSYGFFNEDEGFESLIVTDKLDFGFAGIKQISYLEAGVNINEEQLNVLNTTCYEDVVNESSVTISHTYEENPKVWFEDAYGNVYTESEFIVTYSDSSFTVDFGETVEFMRIYYKQDFKVKLSVAVDYKFHSNDTWSRSNFITLNRENAAFIGFSGTEFRFVFKSTDYRLASLDYLNVRYKAVDKRTVRGIYAN